MVERDLPTQGFKVKLRPFTIEFNAMKGAKGTEVLTIGDMNVEQVTLICLGLQLSAETRAQSHVFPEKPAHVMCKQKICRVQKIKLLGHTRSIAVRWHLRMPYAYQAGNQQKSLTNTCPATLSRPRLPADDHRNAHRTTSWQQAVTVW